MTTKERFEKNCEMFQDQWENLMLSYGYFEGCEQYFYKLIASDIKPTQRALLKDLRDWWAQW